MSCRKVVSSYEMIHVVVDAMDKDNNSEESALEFVFAVASAASLGRGVKLLCTPRYSTSFDEHSREYAFNYMILDRYTS